MGENDLKFKKKGFPDKWKYLTKKYQVRMIISIVLMILKKPINNLNLQWVRKQMSW